MEEGAVTTIPGMGITNNRDIAKVFNDCGHVGEAGRNV
jgi:hypothetical protein